jgi:hypothetical protein
MCISIHYTYHAQGHDKTDTCPLTTRFATLNKMPIFQTRQGTGKKQIYINKNIWYKRSVYLLEILELLIPGQPFLLPHTSMDSNGWEILLD